MYTDDRPVKTYCGGVPHYVETVDSLRQQLAECQAESANWFRKFMEENDALVEAQAREKVLRDALGEYVNVCQSGYDPTNWNTQVVDAGSPARDALALPSDSTALDSAIRQAKREALASVGHLVQTPEGLEELRRMAEEQSAAMTKPSMRSNGSAYG